MLLLLLLGLERGWLLSRGASTKPQGRGCWRWLPEGWCVTKNVGLLALHLKPAHRRAVRLRVDIRLTVWNDFAAPAQAVDEIGIEARVVRATERRRLAVRRRQDHVGRRVGEGLAVRGDRRREGP